MVSPTVSAAEDQGAVRDRLVARARRHAPCRAGAAGGQRRRFGWVQGSVSVGDLRPPSISRAARHPAVLEGPKRAIALLTGAATAK